MILSSTNSISIENQKQGENDATIQNSTKKGFINEIQTLHTIFSLFTYI